MTKATAPLAAPAATMSAAALAERAVRALYDSDSASRSLGMRIVAVAPGRVRVAMRVREDMVNGHALCHGGLIFTLADSAFAFACNSYNERCVAASASIDFLAAAHLGDELEAEAAEVWRSGRQGLYEVVVTRPAQGAECRDRIALFRGRSHRIEGQLVEPA